MKRVRHKKKALTPVIATMILSAVIIAVGGAIWSYAQGASTVIANSYIDDTFDLLDEVTERFTIEHVSNNSDGSTLMIWIFNYGDVDIVVDVYVNSTTDYKFTLESEIESDEIVRVDVILSPSLTRGQEVSIKAHSRRQNNDYYTYYAQ